MSFFEGFELDRVSVGEGLQARVRSGGAGPPVVLLHGHPRTHTTWHRVAPLLVAAEHTVVCLDCAGTGSRRSPRPRPITRRTPSARWPATSWP